MLFVVRGKTPDHQDRILRIKADSVHQAEAIGWARGIFVTEVQTVEQAAARRAHQWATLLKALWRFCIPRATMIFGRPVSAAQSIGFLFLGMATWAVDLCAFHFI